MPPVIVGVPRDGAVGALLTHVVPFEVRLLPDVPGATLAGVFVPLLMTTLFVVGHVTLPLPDPHAAPASTVFPLASNFTQSLVVVVPVES